MHTYSGFFLKARKVLKHKLVSFGPNNRGTIAVEMAFILPIFAMMAFLSFDAGTVYTQYKRGTRHYYALGDILSAQTNNVTCSQLDKMSELVYNSYAGGNWARRPRPDNEDFTADGALDFRFVVRMMAVKDDPSTTNTKLRSEIQWAYWRHTGDMDNAGQKKPGDFVKVPDGLEIDGLNYIHIQGRLFVAPALNYLGVFDYAPENGNQTHKQIVLDRYFPLRFVTGYNLVFSNDDPLTEKCWTIGQSYPPGS